MVRPLLIISKPTPATLIRDRDDRGHPKPLVIREEINAGNLDKKYGLQFQFGQTYFALGGNKWKREPTLCGEAEALVMVEEVNGGQTRG